MDFKTPKKTVLDCDITELVKYFGNTNAMIGSLFLGSHIYHTVSQTYEHLFLYTTFVKTLFSHLQNNGYSLVNAHNSSSLFNKNDEVDYLYGDFLYSNPENLLTDIYINLDEESIYTKGIYAIRLSVVPTKKQELNKFFENFLRVFHTQKITGACFQGVNFDPLNKVKISWEDLKFNKKTFGKIQESLNLIYDESYRNKCLANGIAPSRGMLLYGPPGTGKTSIGKILANDIRRNFVCVRASDLSTNNVHGFFEVIKFLSPCTLFIEDIDIVGKDRTQNDNANLLSCFMNELDGISPTQDLLVVATTNDLDCLEKALVLRPGRFDRLIEVANPDIDTRRELFALNGISIDANDSILKKIASFSPAQIKELCTSAKYCAILNDSLDKDGKVVLTSTHWEQAFSSLHLGNFNSTGFKNV